MAKSVSSCQGAIAIKSVEGKWHLPLPHKVALRKSCSTRYSLFPK
ncbi:hypothetical protein [Okeania sp. SIO3I5]|nr:hypothetical protein [Okeania sp. SIO3I5]